MKRLAKFFLVIASIAIVSCSSSDTTPLSGEWIIEEVDGTKVVGEMTPFIGFNPQDSTVYGNSSCNRFFGRIVYSDNDDSAISFDNLGSTRMMCANSPMEEQILSAIHRVKKLSYNGQGDAELLDDDKTVLLLLTPKKSE